MFRKLLAAVIKEARILIRDRNGMATLFVMPIVLIMVMTLTQDNTFKSINEQGIPIVVFNQDQDSLGAAIYRGLDQSPLCTVTQKINGKKITSERQMREAVEQGTFVLGIVIPKGATQVIRTNIQQIISESMALDTESQRNISEHIDIKLYIDPVAKKTFVAAITGNLQSFISDMKTQVMFQTFSDEMRQLMPEGEPSRDVREQVDVVRYKEVYASEFLNDTVPNAVQHNVPAWTIFGMFFIVIAVVGNIMREKNEGTAFRLSSMPDSYLLMMNGKIIVYVIICFIQFLLMLGVGIFILPLFGLPSLDLGVSPLAVLFLALCTAFAATGFGVLMGTLSKSEQQGSMLGSLSILLLSAIGGVLVPTYVMPDIMRTISLISPLNWSLQGFYTLFLKGGTLLDIWLNCLLLILFFLAMMSISSMVNRFKSKI
jgi:ABC-2 type transport system permease protein